MSASHRRLISGRQAVAMHAWRNVIVSTVVAAGSVAVVVLVRDGVAAALAGAVLVIALFVLARNAIRLASDPARRDVEPPRLHG
jgi:hypothetical protein